ncbi:MAG TPA: GH116 family glycosyl-hydrolase [Chthoniobacterales bacterium]|nr:GH116 family glycosyl-hydrolase [Chthoniobacterales bacterium]
MNPIDSRFIYTGERRRYVAFPLGGIGTGSVSLTGSGRLSDWSIRNRPAIHEFNGYSHFAIKAEQAGKLLGARVLNGPYEGVPTGSPSVRKFDGFGFGANRDTLTGVPHFDEVTFIGQFPVAELEFHHVTFPGQVRMTAFSPFIPHNDRDSSMPVAFFRFSIQNRTEAPIDYTLAATVGNYGCDSGIHTFYRSDPLSILHFTSAQRRNPEEEGDLAIITDGEEVEHVDYHFRGQWFDSLARYWREFAQPGKLRGRSYENPRAVRNMFQQPEHGTLAVRVRIEPGETREVRFTLSWNYPFGGIYWFDREGPGSPSYPGSPPTWKNYYATQWPGAVASGRDAFKRWETLESQTVAVRDSLFGSSLPPEIIDAVNGTLGILRSATVIRLENGELWGWEGQHPNEGSCEGSCTHVWNYQQTIANLFPALERSLRETEFTYNQLPSGGLTFRQRLPLGSGFDIIGPCADGHFGAIIKTYREWKNLGDNAWLQRFWPNIRRALEYAWSEENPDQWDPKRTGVLWGRQHHTLDMELFGPSSWLTTMYLAALKAGAAMAQAMGDSDFAKECWELAAKGGEYVDGELFNGRYYVQKLDLSDRSVLAPFDQNRKAGVLRESFMEAYWSDEYGEIKYQIGEGCLTDQILGQWHADIAGLGDLLAPANVVTALKSVFEQNYLADLRDHFNPCRVYAYENEGGLLNCTWPDGATKPALPVPYAEEIWTGLEYMMASHLIQRGLVEEGLTIVRSARARHDGSRRNPWNDMECGSYYIRALSSYALVNAYSGFSFDQRSGEIGLRPARSGDGIYFWSGGRGWGVIEIKETGRGEGGTSVTITVKGGELTVSRLRLPGRSWSAAVVDGRTAGRDDDAILLGTARTLQAGDSLAVELNTDGDA